MNQYPPASKRKYVKITPYRDYSVALYRAPENAPAFEINGLPIRELFFVLDEMGDNVLPVDCPLGSVFECYAAIDAYMRCDNDAWRAAHPTKPLWSLIHENVAAGTNFVTMVDFLRELEQRIIAFDAEDEEFGDDPSEWREDTLARISKFWKDLTGTKKVTGGPDGIQIEK